MKPMPRDQFIERQSEELDKIFALTLGEDHTREHFLQMAIETYDYLAATGDFVWTFKINPDSAFNFINQIAVKKAGGFGTLVKRWRQWKDDYPELLRRNPKLEVHDMMSAISETHIFTGWPDPALEESIQDWLDKGSLLPLPFDDRLDIVTEAFYQKLRDLRRRVDGWLHYDEKSRRVLFSQEREWQVIRAERRAATVRLKRSFRQQE